MKNKLKPAAAVIVVLAVVIAIVPYQCGLVVRDGGSKHWQALTWEVHRYHQYHTAFDDGNGTTHIDEGWRIRLFGITIRDDAEHFDRQLY